MYNFVNKERMLVVYYFPIVYLCGGLLFHLIWETKSQYVWTYVYNLIPLAMCGWVMILKKQRSRNFYIWKIRREQIENEQT